jgi:HK97 family phage portal protein
MRIFGREIIVRKAAPSGLRQIHGGGFWGAVRESFAGAWQRGVTVDPIGSLTSFGAVFACISRIAQDIAKLELELKVETDDGIEIDAPATSPYWQVLRKPNSYQNRIQFLTSWVVSKLLFGNAYALKMRDQRGIVTALYLLDPRRVTPMVTPEGDVYYSLGGDDLSRVPAGQVIPAREIIHDRGITLWHPLVGVSPIYACATAATQGARIQGNSATFFENMSRPSGMLTAPGTIDEVTAGRLKADWEQNYGGANLGRLAILGDGLKYEAMTIPANDAQLIEQLNWTVEDVARCFGVPLYKINAGPVPTAGNVEALESQYYSGCLQIAIESIELCLTEGLAVPTGYEVELDLGGLLRMDSATQIEMLAKAVGGAIMAPNEARKRRNLAPVAGGDSVYLQQQNYSLEALAKRDSGADPFGTAKPVAPPAAPAPEEDPPEDNAREIAAMAQKSADETRDLIASHVERMQADADRRRADDEAARASVDALIASVPLAVKAAIADSAQPADDEDLAKALIARFAELDQVDG